MPHDSPLEDQSPQDFALSTPVVAYPTLFRLSRPPGAAEEVLVNHRDHSVINTAAGQQLDCDTIMQHA